MNRIFHAVQMMSVTIALTFASITYGALQELVEHYSTQKLFALNPEDTYSFTLNDGSVRTIRLIEFKGFRDSVMYMMSRVEVDVDFCTIKVYAPPVAKTDDLPALFMTFTPTLGISTGNTVRFRIWLQGADEETPISIDFGDGSKLEHYRSYIEKTHRYRKAGIYVVTASCTVTGCPLLKNKRSSWRNNVKEYF